MIREVNQYLLGLLFLACLGTILLVVYYNLSFDGLNEKYRDSIRQVDDTSALLNETIENFTRQTDLLKQKEDLLQDYLKELNHTRIRESALGKHYENLSGEADRLELDLEGMQDDRDKWRSEYGEAQQEANVCTADLRLKNNRISEIKKETSSLKVEVGLTKEGLTEMDSILSSLRKDVGEISDISEDLDQNISESIEEEITSIRSDINAISNEIVDMRKSMDDVYSGLSGFE